MRAAALIAFAALGFGCASSRDDSPAPRDAAAPPDVAAPVAQPSDGATGDLSPIPDLASPADIATYPDLANVCHNGVQDQNESDVDCGGGICLPCDLGLHCRFDSDCLSNTCSNKVCQRPPSCIDGIQDGLETDIDCGGGACVPCGLGKACISDGDCLSNRCTNKVCDAGPESLAANLSSPFDIALDNQYVYWVENNANGALRRVPRAGGAAETLALNLAEPTAVVVDNAYAYVLERNGGWNGMIHRVALNGGNPEIVADKLHNAQNHLAQDAGNLYWGDYDVNLGGIIKTAPKAANAKATILVDKNGMTNLNAAIDVGMNAVYFKNDLGKMLAVPTGGGNVTVLADATPSSLRVVGATIFFTDFNLAMVGSVPAQGGKPTMLNGAPSAADLAVDDKYVYWIEQRVPGSVNRTPSDKVGPKKIYYSEGNTIGIEVDLDYVYFAVSTMPGKGRIMRTRK